MERQIVKNNKNSIPSGVQTVLDVLECAGYEAWLVGGCVRDRLLGCSPKDYDVTTCARVDRVMDVFRDFRVIETGIKHGTVTVISEGMPVEVTTFRVDGNYSDGRHPDSVDFASDIRDDLSRRDFTVNAIAYSPARGYLDLFGGMSDLRSGIIRCVGDPSVRFGEDALRILRALRFASVLGFDIEPGTAEAIHRCKGLLDKIAVERITQELFKLLCGAGAEDVLRTYSDVIFQIIPPLSRTFGFRQHNPHHDFDVWEHTVRTVASSPPDRTIRLAALFHDVGKPDCFTIDRTGTGHFYGHAAKSVETAREIFDRYIRTDKKTVERVLMLVKSHDEQIIPERRIMRRRLNKYGEEALRQLIALNRADTKSQTSVPSADRLSLLDRAEEVLDELVAESACTTLRDLKITGGDLMAAGAPKGPMIGKVLNALLSEVCDEKLENSAEALRARAVELIRDFSGS